MGISGQMQNIIKGCLLLQIFKCRGKHQLDPVQLVDFAGARVIIDGDDVAVGILTAQLFDHAFPTTWLGRQPKGWVHTILGVPEWINSNISPVKNHPSPVWLPMETMVLA